MQKLPIEIAKPIFAIMYKKGNENLFEEALKIIEKEIGEIDYMSPPYDFPSLENYYSKEMDSPLLKVFISLKDFCLKSKYEDEKAFEKVKKYNEYISKLKDKEYKVKIIDKDIVELKHYAMNLEDKYRDENKNRRLNIDVGYLDEFQLILASHKRRGARIYAGKNVYLELEYLYFDKDFQEQFWTYADYKDERTKNFFRMVRNKFLEDRKKFINIFKHIK